MKKTITYFYGLCGDRKFGEELRKTMGITYGANFEPLYFLKVKYNSKIGKIIAKAVKLWLKESGVKK